MKTTEVDEILRRLAIPGEDKNNKQPTPPANINTDEAGCHCEQPIPHILRNNSRCRHCSGVKKPYGPRQQANECAMCGGGGDPTWACGACGDGYHVRPGNEVAPTHSNRQENKPMQFEQPCPKRKGESNNRYNAYMWATSET